MHADAGSFDHEMIGTLYLPIPQRLPARPPQVFRHLQIGELFFVRLKELEDRMVHYEGHLPLGAAEGHGQVTVPR
jgi:hypothetical protein